MAKKPVEERDPEAVRRGKAARSKGQRGERAVCAILEQITGVPHKRNLGQARDSGCDIDFGPFLLEAKHQERLKMPEWQQQVIEAAKPVGKIPAIVFKRNAEPFWVALPFAEFVTMVHALRQYMAQGESDEDGTT